MRLIDVDVLDEALTALRFTADGKLAHWGDRKEWCLHGSEIETLIANAPTVEAEPIRHGEWIKNSNAAFYWKCSECGAYLFWRKEEYLLRDKDYPRYCPNCGAKMGGETDE